MKLLWNRKLASLIFSESVGFARLVWRFHSFAGWEMSQACSIRQRDLGLSRLKSWCPNAVFIVFTCWKCDVMSVAKTISITNDRNSLKRFNGCVSQSPRHLKNCQHSEADPSIISSFSRATAFFSRPRLVSRTLGEQHRPR